MYGQEGNFYSCFHTNHDWPFRCLWLELPARFCCLGKRPYQTRPAYFWVI